MKIYVLRHGTTDWNKEGRLQGARDIPLNENGILLARQTAEGMKHIHFDRVISSPLSRAVDTARIVMGDRDIPFETDARVAERNFGLFEGRICRGDKADLPPNFLSLVCTVENSAYAPEEGESLIDVFARTGDFLRELLNKKEWEQESILVSTHGLCSRAILHHIWQDDDFWHGQIPPNCCVSIISAENGQVTNLETDIIYYKDEPEDFYHLNTRKDAAGKRPTNLP
ncbi:MAG: histidine phosphatase family protein [Lachnospiraceae bacterium]|nr:histidine phosphatase family protein [Lachnospiraceae bacterium]